MENSVIPQHIGFIMDGNGRWAKKRMLPRSAGHVQGSKVVERICKDAYDLGIKYLTVYAFSTENWNRAKEEVDAIMKLLYQYLEDCIKRSTKNNMRVRVLGDISRLDKNLQLKITELERVSEGNTGLCFQVALNYGGRDEIIRGVKEMAKKVAEGELLPDEITPQLFENYLDTKGIPDPDLVIRTSGEMRISNFLIWQCSYSEFYFTDVLWPDFNKEELKKALDYYAQRDRRFGKE